MSKSIDTNDAMKIYELRELAALMVKDQGLHDGLYELSIEIQVAVGVVGPDKDSVLPGALIGFKSAGLRKVEKSNRLSVNAAEVNPATTRTRSRRKKPA